jgi:ATP-dependent Clp protease ATP-binding subunit ClpA
MEIQDEALVAAAKLSGRYIPGGQSFPKSTRSVDGWQVHALLIVIKAFFFLPARHFPDKAIDLVDKACATARLLMNRRKKQATSNDDILLVPKDTHRCHWMA